MSTVKVLAYLTMSVYLHDVKDDLIKTLANDVLMHGTSTVKNANFNTYDFLPER